VPATIVGCGAAAPADVLTNAELEAVLDTSDRWIVERTGIRERRIAADGESSASLGVAAGRAALTDAGIAAGDVDMLVVATATPEQPIPHTGAFVADGLGLACGSFDVGAGCAGFVYAVVVAAALLGTGTVRNVLVVGTETLSRVVDPADRSTRILFGDAAGAAVVSASEGPGGILSWDLGCDGSAAGLLGIPAGGSRRPASPETVTSGEHYLRMSGREVFRRAVGAIVSSAEATLRRAEASAASVDWFVPHQANARIIEAARQRLGIPAERTVLNIERFGNTSAASIPLALTEAAADGRLADGDRVLLAGFGAGMTWASALLDWGRR